MQKSIAIVGAGISGLSAGIYAQANGYKTTIFEMNSIPGGLCTAWKRKGYKFDISMHMLTGSVSGPFHEMWKELGVIQNFKFHFHQQSMQIEKEGQKIAFSVEQKKMEQEMISISPEDSKLIKQFTRLIFGPDMMKAASLKPRETKTLADGLKTLPAILPVIPNLIRYNGMSIQQFATKFKNPFLRDAIRFFIDAPGWPMPDFPMVALSGFIRSGITEAGVPIGGSQKVMLHLADLYKKLGGKILYNSKTTNLIIENGKVVGIVQEDGTEHRADQIIWAADGHYLHYNILKGAYLNDKIRKMFEEWVRVKPLIHVMMGVDLDLSGEPNRMLWHLEKTIVIAGRERKWITAIHRGFDRSMAPEGKTALEVWFDTEYEYWDKLKDNRELYEAEKKKIADITIGEMEKRCPGFALKVEMVDVPTPLTYFRYTGNWEGSPDGWYVTTKNVTDMEPLRSVPNLGGLYLAGQWTSPYTGTVMAALSGRQIIEIMCKNDHIKFETNLPV
jgi:phytoene dehydrogenase-like protein